MSASALKVPLSQPSNDRAHSTEGTHKVSVAQKAVSTTPGSLHTIPLSQSSALLVALTTGFSSLVEIVTVLIYSCMSTLATFYAANEVFLNALISTTFVMGSWDQM